MKKQVKDLVFWRELYAKNLKTDGRNGLGKIKGRERDGLAGEEIRECGE